MRIHPAPVLQTKAVVQDKPPSAIRVIIDNSAAAQNVTRFLESRRYTVKVEEKNGDFIVIGRGSGYPDVISETPTTGTEPAEQKIMILPATDRIGFGDDELGQKQMLSFIKTLKEMGPELWRLVFVNNGVKLTV